MISKMGMPLLWMAWFRFVDRFTRRQNRPPGRDIGRRYGHQIDVEGREIGPLADLDRAELVFTK